MNDANIFIPAQNRGSTELNWLKSYHSFSFGDYYNPNQMGFRTLRVINDDFIAPGGEFQTHPHRNMEIISVVLSGQIQHKDSLGNSCILRAGEVQAMTAGKGIFHSEANPSMTEALHLLQIWITPNRTGLTPGYRQQHFPIETRKNSLLKVVSGSGDQSLESTPLAINQDANLYLLNLEKLHRVEHPVAESRGIWIQVASGRISISGRELTTGDGLGLNNCRKLELTGVDDNSEVLVFDLA